MLCQWLNTSCHAAQPHTTATCTCWQQSQRQSLTRIPRFRKIRCSGTAAGLSRGSGQQHKAPHGRCLTVPSAEAAAFTLHHVNTLHGTLQSHPSEGIIPAFQGPLLAVGMVLAVNKNNLPHEPCLKAVGFTLQLGCFPDDPEHHPTPCGRGAGGHCAAFHTLCFSVPGRLQGGG